MARLLRARAELVLVMKRAEAAAVLQTRGRAEAVFAPSSPARHRQEARKVACALVGALFQFLMMNSRTFLAMNR